MSITRSNRRQRPVPYRPMVECLEGRIVPSTGFVETPLVTNIPGLAPNTDKNLTNPWGFAETSAGQFRVAANGSGRGILLDAQGEKSGADIIIPPPAGSPSGTTSTPNGVISNPTSDFVITVKGRSAPATLLFSTEDGTIAGWNPALSQTRAVIAADQSGNGAVYKLLAMGQVGSANYLYATNFHNGTVDVFDKNFALHTFFNGQFTDPNAPAGFAPFGVKSVDGILFVTYAKQDAAKHDDVAGPGNGFIDEFDTSGHFLKRFASGTSAGGTLTALNSPIGATLAPAGFGDFGGDLLIGNFGDSHVSAFNPNTGEFLGQLQDVHGQPLVLDAGITGSDGNTKGLWGIGFGNGQGGAGTQTLFFAAGPNDESDGVFGKVNADPPAKSAGDSPSFAVAVFNNGLWLHSDSSGWQQLSTAHASLAAVDDHGDVAAAFTNGVWLLPAGETNFELLTGAIPSQLDIAGNAIVVAEFPGNGVWRHGDAAFADGGWQQLNAADALSVADDDQGDTVASFPGSSMQASGVYLFQDASGWQQLTPAVATQVSIASSGVDLAAAFGSGLWRLNLSSDMMSMGWQQLNAALATSLAVGFDGSVVAEFGNGVWLFQDTVGWTNLSSAFASQVSVGSTGEVFAEFPGNGVWEFSNGAWQQLAQADAQSLDGAGG